MSPRKLDDRQVVNNRTRQRRVRQALAAARDITVASRRLVNNSVMDEVSLAERIRAAGGRTDGSTSSKPR
jgi:hypothetical protein